MNNPGPITLRRNAIQFSGSDEDLCQYLLEEDGVKAKVCHRPHADLNNKLIITANSNGNRYIVGSSSDHGYIKPPKGALKLLPQQSNNETTAVEQRRNQKSIWSMKGWINGYFEVQDMGSQIIVQSLELTGRESVLDYCAGNGGKTFSIASALMNNDNNRAQQHSKIVAHDVVEERLRQIKGSMTRVGFHKVNDEESNKSTFSASNGDNKCTIQLCKPADLGTSSFDAVLVDAPCSSSGVLRRRPSQRWGLTEQEVCKVLPNLQLEILLKAASFVSDKGRLVYSTCSLLEEENESVVKQFEQTSEGFEPWKFDISNTNNRDREESDEVSNNMQHTITLLPSDESDGFFIARWKRVL